MLVWWLTTPLSCRTGSSICGVAVSSHRRTPSRPDRRAVGPAAWTRRPARARRRRLAAVAVGLVGGLDGRLGAVVAVVVAVVVVRTVVRLGVVGRLVAPAEAGDDDDQAADGRQAEVEDEAVADDRQTGGEHEGPVRRRGQVHPGAVTRLRDLGAGGGGEAALVVLLVLAVPELVEVRHGRHGVEVVRRHRRLDHPLEAAGVPRVGPGADRGGPVAPPAGEDVPPEDEHRHCDDEHADGRRHVQKVEP